tara:strand:- start:411 stop:908 length:498 start_codon:yes stop_codon:yes gene_type:complete
MYNFRRLVYTSLFYILISCSSKRLVSTINNERDYFEDLSYIRSQEERIIIDTASSELISDTYKNDISYELDSIIKIIKDENKSDRFLEGYTIQLYLGGDRIKAEEIEEKITEIDSLIFKNTVFTQPNYRVKIGQYIDRFKVAEEYQRFKKLFPNAIIIPERIKVN